VFNKKEKLKLLFLLLFLVSSIFMLSGCSGRPNLITIGLEYMENKYGERFEYRGPWGGMSSRHFTQFLATSNSFPDHLIFVEVNNSENNMIVKDNFLAVKHYNATVELLYHHATTIFDEAIIHYNVSKHGLSPDLSANATLYEVLADTNRPFIIMIEVKESNISSRTQVEEVGRLIAENIERFILTIVVVDNNVYNTLTRDELNSKIGLGRVIAFNITNSNGNVNTTQVDIW